MKLLSFVAGVAMMMTANASALTAADMKAQISENGLEMVLKGDDGKAFGVAQIFPSTWSGEEMTGYDVRFSAGTDLVTIDMVEIAVYDWQANSVMLIQMLEANSTPVGGQFVTGLRGKLEKWDKGGDSERYVVVFRNAEGQFVTHVDVDENVESYWNSFDRNGDVVDRYETRWSAGTGALSGRMINAVELEKQLETPEKAYHMVPGKACPVLALRDTSDGPNNGKFVTSIYGVYGLRTVEGHATRKAVCYYKGQDQDGKVKVLTWGLLERLNDY
ncbi:MAG: hypothetical protein AAF202_01110 [Pseudomonadota bacterium]